MTRLLHTLSLMAALIVPAIVPVAAQAQQNPVVVELFTSQGCSSCPPADEMLAEMATRDDIIALAMHVDYWDYIGWKDIFGSPEHTRRQNGYARAASADTIYTPQFVIGGQDHVVGAKAMEVMDTIRAQSSRDTGVQVTMRRDGARFVIEAQADRPFARAAVVQIVRYTPSQSVDIRRGENAGRQITYHNIVTSMAVIGEWDGRSPLQVQANAAGNSPAVVIVQAPGHGPILAAARTR